MASKNRVSPSVRASRLVKKGKHIGFQALEAELAAKGDRNPGGLARYIGERKYTPAGFKALQMAGRAKHRARKG